MKARVVVVEDETIVALDIKQSLERSGYSVAGVYSSAEQSIEEFPALQANIVLMDIRLQGKMDGVEAAGIIRLRFNVPVVLLTAYADEATIERAKITEPFGYIIKPFEERDLRSTIEIALYRHELGRKLEESEERYRRFFRDDLSGNFVASPDGTIVECNASFASIFGFSSSEQMLGANLNELFARGEDRSLFWTDLNEKRFLKLRELSLRSKEKGGIVALTNVVGYVDAENRLTEIKGYLIDITEQRRLERQLRESQKMEAIGRLAGGVAHDFNNLLTVIMGYSTLLREKVQSGRPVDRDIEGIQNAAKKATTLTKQLLAFSKRQVLNPVVTNVNDLVRDLERILKRLVTENISMHVYTEAARPFSFIDPGQFEQALINLVANARDAMPHGGQLVIETRNIAFERTFVALTGAILPGEYLRISVSDTGVGIERELLSKIFEPFYTTKSEEGGTGLGLATVFGIVEQSRGYIHVESEPHRGSTFMLYFPLSESVEAASSTAQEPPSGAAGNETILVVEDEENVRSLISKLLSLKGYRVFEAGNAGEALLICEQEGRDIQLLVSDVVMPHMDGRGLASRLRALRPNLKILLMSGYPDHTVNRSYEGIDDAHFIQKPFDPTTFMNTVRSILDN